MRIPAKQLELRSASRYRTAADSGTISALLMEFLLEEKKLGRAVRTAADEPICHQLSRAPSIKNN
jgi:hypothetical protein